MRERDIEAKLVREIKKMGGECLKWVSPGTDGVPDRIVIMPSGDIWFVELKTDKGELSGPQEYWNRRLQELGCSAVVLYGQDQVQWFLDELRKYGWTQQIKEMIWGMVEEGGGE